MVKIAINNRIGGFSLSKKAMEELGIRTRGSRMFDDMNCPCNLDFGLPVGEEDNHYAYRAHPKLIEVIERLGKEANGELANIKIVEVPEDIEWGIGESEEGYEWVYEEHRTWE